MMIRKTLAFLTALAVLAAGGYSQMIMESGRNGTVFAEESGIEYEFDVKTGTLVKCICKDKDIVIPSEIDGVPVVSIGEYAFYRSQNPERITLPDSIERISEYSFSGCTGLKEIIIPDSVNIICEYAFSNCKSLGSITLPGSVKGLGDSAFENCTSLTDVVLDCDIGGIGSNTFRNCSKLTDIKIPEGVVSIQDSAFENCESLKNIILPDTLQYIAEKAFYMCSGLEKLSVPDGVSEIEPYAFSKCTGLEDIILPDSITAIGDHAFYECSGLKKITIPERMTNIGEYVFSKCTSLESVTLSENLTEISEYAFCESPALTKISIPDSVEKIGKRAFFGCSGLSEIILPEGIKSIDEGVFASCISLKTIKIPEGVLGIGSSAFNNCSGLESIVFPDSLAGIGEYSFDNCRNLKKINLPENVKRIYPHAFTKCSGLSEVVIPKNVTHIGECAFMECSELKSVSIPEGVESIGTFAFYHCPALSSVTVPESVESIGDHAFGYTGIYEDGKFTASKYDGFFIRGYRNSAAEEYAKNFDIEFIAVDDEITVKGDLNGDSLFNAGDALYFKEWMLGTEENDVSVSARGDINKDGVINVVDFIELKSMLLDTGEAKNPVELNTEVYGFDEGFETAGKENVIGVVTSDSELYDFLEKAQIDKEKVYDINESAGVAADFMPSESDYEKYVYIFCTSEGSAYHNPQAESILSDSSIDITVTHYNNMNIKYLFRIEVPKEKYQNQTVNIKDHSIEYAPGEPIPCKPVIYLYPEETTDINVRVHINDSGNLTYTYPQYNRFTGWNVTADPDSVLHDASGREYSYLFWEGVSSQKWDMSSGFVVKGTDTVRFLQEKLEYLGLTPREYNEFIVYWMPRMQDNKYNLISFQTEKYEEYASLEITPKPDCIQRVFMAFKPLDQYTEIPEQKLESFERHGYSVIEWGGVEVTGDEYTVE